MRCVIHIGTEKTGSTTLQRTLRDNRPLLEKNGILFSRAAGEQLSRDLAECFIPFDSQNAYIRQRSIDDPAKYTEWQLGKLSEVREEIANAKRTLHTYILSCEHFSSQLRSSESVERLANFLQDEFSEVTVVCYLRRQDSLAVSRINENLKAGFTIMELPSISSSAALPKLYNYADLLDRWASCFGRDKVCVRLFEPDRLINGNVVADFVGSALLGALELPLGRHENVSLDATGQLALKMFNVGLGEELRLQTAPLRRKLIKYLAAESSNNPYRPSRASALAFYEHFKVGNGDIAKNWFGETLLFHENFDSYEEHPTDPDNAAASALLGNFFLNLYR